MKKSYKIEVDCASCAAKMEDEIRKIPSIEDVNINFIMKKIKLRFEEGTDIESKMEEVENTCKKIESDCQIAY